MRGSVVASVKSRSVIVGIAAPLVAALGCLQPGIDPVFLSLLSNASHIPTASHGMIVGVTQAGAALGSLAVWKLGPALPHRAILAAALVALLCSLGTVLCEGLAITLGVRGGYGLAMGMVYAHAMAAYARKTPNKAYGAVFLIQLVLSTLLSLLLPEMEVAIGADLALSLLALAPAFALVSLLILGPAHGRETRSRARSAVPLAGWALAAATFWFICSTMLVWSFAASLANSAGIDNLTIGRAVALGSIVGALTAGAVMRERLIVPLPITALLAGAGLASPIVLTMPGESGLFVLSIVLLNIGSTAIIIRCSGLATATSTDSRFRTFVACTHSLGLIAGPLLGATMMAWFGPSGLLGGVIFALAAGLAAVILASFTGLSGPTFHPFKRKAAKTASQVRMALD